MIHALKLSINYRDEGATYSNMEHSMRHSSFTIKQFETSFFDMVLIYNVLYVCLLSC